MPGTIVKVLFHKCSVIFDQKQGKWESLLVCLTVLMAYIQWWRSPSMSFTNIDSILSGGVYLEKDVAAADVHK